MTYYYESLIKTLNESTLNRIDRMINAMSTDRLKDLHRDARFLCEVAGVEDPETHYIWITSGMEWQDRDYREWCKHHSD